MICDCCGHKFKEMHIMKNVKNNEVEFLCLCCFLKQFKLVELNGQADQQSEKEPG